MIARLSIVEVLLHEFRRLPPKGIISSVVRLSIVRAILEDFD
jgi:hypothetical protein